MYTVIFNTAAAISKMPKRRKNWQDQLRDDFLRAIHGKKFNCQDAEELRSRMNFIAGNSFPKGNIGESDFVILSDPAYGERTEPIKMWGIPQGYVSFDQILQKADTDGCAIIPFRCFYDQRQKVRFSGCYVEVFKGE